MSINTVSELVVYGLTALCLLHAYKQGRGWLAVYLGACLNGFVLEYAAVRTDVDYEYARFMIMIPSGGCPDSPMGSECVGAVPLWIALGWGFVVYLAMQTSMRLDMAWYLKPAHDALLAVNFDWLMDPIAVKLGWWIWDKPGQYFGVPLDNYFGWIICVGGFSLSVRAMRRYLFRNNAKLNANLTPFLAVLTGPLIVYGAIKAYMFVWHNMGVSPWFILGVTLVFIYSISLAHWSSKVSTQKPDWLIIGSGFSFQLYFWVLLWSYGVFSEHPALITLSMLTLMVTWFGYTNPYAIKWIEDVVSATGDAAENQNL